MKVFASTFPGYQLQQSPEEGGRILQPNITKIKILV